MIRCLLVWGAEVDRGHGEPAGLARAFWGLDEDGPLCRERRFRLQRTNVLITTRSTRARHQAHTSDTDTSGHPEDEGTPILREGRG